MNGMTYTGDRYCPTVQMGSAVANRSLDNMRQVGVDWVSIVVTQYQQSINSTDIFPLYEAQPDAECDYYTFVTATEAHVRQAIQKAKALGMKVMLKPHVDIIENHMPCGAHWRGDIGKFFNASQWTAWQRSYTTMFDAYAQMAREEQVDMISLNCELIEANKQTAFWKTLAASVRASGFKGKLTTAANWWPGTDGVQYWDVLDVIGIDAYYPLNGTTLAELVAAWKPVLSQLEQVSTSVHKPVIFSELGFTSGDGLRNDHPTPADYAWQATQYEAVFEATKSLAWFQGTFWWNWDTDAGYAPGDACFTPQWKPVSKVLASHYGGTLPNPDASIKASCYGFGKCTS